METQKIHEPVVLSAEPGWGPRHGRGTGSVRGAGGHAKVVPALLKGKDVDGAMHDVVDATVRYTMARILERSTVVASTVRKGELLIKGPCTPCRQTK